MKNIYLNSEEEKALDLMSQWVVTGRDLYEACRIPASGMSVFRSEIKRKTGIHDLKDTIECKRYLAEYESARQGFGKIPQDVLQLMGYLLDGETYEGIAYRRKTTREDIMEQVERAYSAFGILTKDYRARAFQLRVFLAVYKPIRPLDPFDLKALTLFARFMPYPEIADELKIDRAYVQEIVRGACYHVGLSCRGRDTQRHLVALYLKATALKEEAPISSVSMDDPAF